MCGIAGAWSKNTQTSFDDILKKMSYPLTLRGPDSSGEWKENGIHLIHKRLSIYDVTASGSQPMTSSSGRFVLTFNGSIYNHKELKKELHSNWRSQSDTEVLLEGISLWGLEKTLSKVKGMFALALWDREQKCLHLARDTHGEKPLFYQLTPEACFISSLLNFPSQEVDQNSVIEFIKYRYVPAPHTLLKNTYKVPAGKILTFTSPETFHEKSYENSAELKSHVQFYDEAVNELEAKLSGAIALTCAADVPVGAFLSGGIDSGLISSLMQKQSAHPIKTFSFGFNEDQYDESKSAHLVAKHIGTDHHHFIFSAQDALRSLDSLTGMIAEPMADQSLLPLFFLSQKVKDHVKVILSGDAGDELFGGYQRYPSSVETWKRRDEFTAFQKWTRLARYEYQRKFKNRSESFTSELLKFEDFSAFYHKKMQTSGTQALKGKRSFEPIKLPSGLDPYQQMMLLDQQHYLREYVLPKVDRASMAHGLEVRIPFLDKDVYKFASTLATSYKIEGNKTKKILRDLSLRHLPSEIVNRPKHGIDVPVDIWLRNELKDWAQENLFRQSVILDSIGAIDLVTLWKEHQAGADHSSLIWSVLMLQKWEGLKPL